MIGLLIIAGIAEGIGLVSLLPLLEFGTGDAETHSGLTRSVASALETVGVAPSLGAMLLLIVVMITLKAVFVWLAMRQVGFTVAQVGTDLRLRLIRALLRAEWRFFSKHPAGYFANSISSEAKRASTGYQYACQGIAGAIQILIYMAAVIVVSWQVAVLALVIAPVVFYLLRGFVAMARRAGDEQTRLMKDLIGRITEVLPGMKAVKAMGRERAVLPFLERETKEFNRAQQSAIHASESLKAFQEPAIVLVLAAGLYGTVAWGNAPTAAILVAAVLFYRVMTTASQLQRQYQAITDKESAFWSMMATIEQAEAEAEQTPGPVRTTPELRHEIRLDEVSFSYGETAVLRDVSLEIPAGALVAFAGMSGAGKTTLVDLISGLLQPDEGEILVDGVPLRSVDPAAWRSQIGYVPQEMLLFHDSILRNVTLGLEDLGRDRVEWALRAAGAWDFVSAHPDGVDRVVGERGSQLSGGQRQRIGIARALVGRPRLLILDEATTALDPDTEATVCEALANLKGEITIIAISHQEAIRKVADRVFSVSGGRVREKGRSVAGVSRDHTVVGAELDPSS
jgi:ATP-binding cassette, subfamily C, bacterial